MKYLLIFLLSINLAYAVRPSPAKQTAEILNDVYDDFDGATHTGALYVTLSEPATYSPVSSTMFEGVHVDFSVTNVLDSAYTDVITLSDDSRYMSITHNGGGKFVLRRNTTDIGVIAPGEVQYINFSASAGDIIRIESESGTVSTGDLYLNFFN